MTVNNFEQQRYHDKVNCDFAEMIYKQMASIRYGLEFCCDKGSDAIIFRQALVKKEKLDLNDITNPIVDGVVQDVPNGDIIRPIILDCSLITVSFPPKAVGSITWIPCGETKEKIYNWQSKDNGIARTFCYNEDFEPIITGAAVVTTPIDCGTPAPNCTAFIFTLPAPAVEGDTTFGGVEATSCFGSTINVSKELIWQVGGTQPNGFVSSPVCINTSLPITITGDVISDSGNPCT